MRGGNPGRSKNNPEIMRAAIQAVRDGLGVVEAAGVFGTGVDVMGRAFAVLRESPGLAERVIAGEVTIYKAHQIAMKGDMHPCPVCEGKGYVFRKRR